MSTLDEQKRMLLPFLQRADEIEKHDPKVAYYCRMYAVEQGLAIPKSERDPKITGLLDALLVKLEMTKTAANLAGHDGDKVYLEEFALKVFSRADRVDRAGMADKKTAVTFLAAFYFFEILAQFGELAVDIAEKQRYAAWKAAEINKAVREGRTPTPGPAADGPQGGAAPPPPPPPPAASAAFDAAPAAAGGHDEYVQQPHAHYPTDMAPVDDGVGGRDDAAHYNSAGVPPPTTNDNVGDDDSDDDDDDFGLPEPPTSLHQAPSVTTTTQQLPPMAPGTRVLFMDDIYDATGQGARAVRGTVARVDGNVLHVALADRIVPALREQLVYEVQVGDDVRYIRDDAQGEECSVEAADVQHWPPSYTVLMRSGSVRDVSGEYLVPAGALPHTTAAAAQPPAATGAYPTIAPDDDVPSVKPTPGPQNTNTPPPPRTTPAPATTTPPVTRAPPPPPPAAAVIPTAVAGYQPSLAVITEAHKQAKYAVSSLSFEDVPTAVKHLTQALKLLTNPQVQ